MQAERAANAPHNRSLITRYSLANTPHGGGYDDLAFANGMAFVAASNPSNLTNGVNTTPAVAKVVLNGTTATLTPVLLGNATATHTMTLQPVTLNLLDPDSMSVDTAGNVVLIDQAESQIIIIQNAGAPNQPVSAVTVNMQLDDTVWAKATAGRLLVVDVKQNAIYAIRSTFTIGTVNLTTGILTPIANGFTKSTGLVFVPDGARYRSIARSDAIGTTVKTARDWYGRGGRNATPLPLKGLRDAG